MGLSARRAQGSNSLFPGFLPGVSRRIPGLGRIWLRRRSHAFLGMLRAPLPICPPRMIPARFNQQNRKMLGYDFVKALQAVELGKPYVVILWAIQNQPSRTMRLELKLSL
ncbi:MAG TPA: hypothetical protein IAC12_05250 [Candidatus Aphodovivens avistercoris]|nr:hypothetical protein [Candidatus Aphodovivens avistercoris]